MSWSIDAVAPLPLRITVGVAIFAVLAIVDLRRNGRAATRWREYGLLLASVTVACAFGIIDDQITSRISWEYFYYGKELDLVLGPMTPPDPARLHWEAAKVGAEATWSVGLILGVALLIANNPRRGLPRLANRRLLPLLPAILATSAGLGVVGGWLGFHGFLNHFSTEFEEMARYDIFRPHNFLCVWGVHLGDYVGGLLGGVVAVVWVVRRRFTLAAGLQRPSYSSAPGPDTSSQ
jgi:hypothetical protein